jgi:cytochrome c553
VLKTRCSPCHEPGGQLYDRLPFDNPKVVSSHSEKVLRRLKGEDRQALERWLATLKPPS